MHIVMVSDLETQGGAAIAASRLAQALCHLGHKVTRIVNIGDGVEHNWRTAQLSFAPYDRVAKRVVPSPIFKTVAGRFYKIKLANILKTLKPDVINVHNIHCAAPLGWSPVLTETCLSWAPTVWTLHDMWSFTGRCAYSYDCRKFIEGCDARCPTPYEYPVLAPRLIKRAWRTRQSLLASNFRLTAITPSRWLAREAQAGLWVEHRVETIPNGLPLKIFRPVKRAFAREALGICAQGAVLLVVAVHLAERRKGGDLLVSALPRVAPRPLTIITLGTGRLAIESEGVHVRSLGYVDHERTRVLAYNAADLLVHPAPVDNLPNVVMESIACGTPVVAFPAGGIPEMVRPGKTGWLADEVSFESFREALDRALIDLKQSSDLRQACRSFAEDEWSDEIQAKRYLALINDIQR